MTISKTVTSIVIGGLYTAGLLFDWWPPNPAAESFIVLFFGVGMYHKKVKADRSIKEENRRMRRELDELKRGQENPDRDDVVRRYEGIDDLLEDKRD